MRGITQRPGLLISALAAIAVSVALVISACGSSDSSTTNNGKAGNATDGAFAAGMIPHHQSAIELAKIARQQSDRPAIQSMAGDIITTQAQEITRLRAIQKTLPDGEGRQMGSLDMDVATLQRARPFDRAFIDMMVPHHADAVRMSRIELAKGKNPQLRLIAQDIIAAQTKEVGQMRAWRKDWYGSAGMNPIRPSDSGDPMMDGTGGSSDDGMTMGE